MVPQLTLHCLSIVHRFVAISMHYCVTHTLARYTLTRFHCYHRKAFAQKSCLLLGNIFKTTNVDQFPSHRFRLSRFLFAVLEICRDRRSTGDSGERDGAHTGRASHRLRIIIMLLF